MTNESAKYALQYGKYLNYFIHAYLLLVIILFYFGPWPWVVYDSFTFIVFLASAQAFILLGYFAARWSFRQTLNEPDPDIIARNQKLALKLFKISIVVNFALFFPTSLSRTGVLIPDVWQGISYAGEVYNSNYERLTLGNQFVLFEYIRLLLGPLLVLSFPLTIFLWSRLNVWWKIAAVASVLVTVSIYLAVGINKGIADIVITFPWLYLMRHAAFTPKKQFFIRPANILFLVAFVVFLMFFGATQEGREGNVGVKGIFGTGAYIISADSSGFAGSDQWRIVYESLVRYLTQGYQALSMAMTLENPGTYGLGNSMFLAQNAVSITGNDYFINQSLPGLLETKYGWSRLLLWHSLYTWLISDFGYVGTVALMGLLAYTFFMSWYISIRYRDPWFIALSYMYLIVFYYIPANNQVMQSGESAIAFLVLSIVCLFRIRRYRLRPRGEAHRTRSAGRAIVDHSRVGGTT